MQLDGGETMKLKSYSRAFTQRGVVLVEAMVAILLFSVGVLAVAGLQTTMLKNNSDAKYRIEANYIAQQMIGQMWANPASTYANLNVGTTDISNLLPGGQVNVSQALVNGPYLIVVSWRLPGQDPHKFVTSATIAPCQPGINAC
jgi:type IV pilus assembly protein PilV